MSKTKKPSVTLIKLTRVIRPESAEAIKATLHGRTYMNLEVLVCPDGGEFQVSVQTRREDTSEAELTEMVLGVMCDSIVHHHKR
jgi:hypothetical protein